MPYKRAVALVHQPEAVIFVAGDLADFGRLMVAHWSIGCQAVGSYLVELVAERKSARCVQGISLVEAPDSMPVQGLVGIPEGYLIVLETAENC